MRREERGEDVRRKDSHGLHTNPRSGLTSSFFTIDVSRVDLTNMDLTHDISLSSGHRRTPPASVAIFSGAPPLLSAGAPLSQQ